MTIQEALEFAAAAAIGCTSAAEAAEVEAIAGESEVVAGALRRHRETVAGLDALMGQNVSSSVWERIAQALG